MKKITKKNNKILNDEVEEIIISMGGECVSENKSDIFPYKEFIFKGENNNYTIKLTNNTGSEVFSVFGRFNKPIKGIGNIFTGKNNFHISYLHSIRVIINEFSVFLSVTLDKIYEESVT